MNLPSFFRSFWCGKSRLVMCPKTGNWFNYLNNYGVKKNIIIIGDLSQTHRRTTCFIRDRNLQPKSHRRQACLIGDPSEADMPCRILYFFQYECWILSINYIKKIFEHTVEFRLESAGGTVSDGSPIIVFSWNHSSWWSFQKIREMNK